MKASNLAQSYTANIETIRDVGWYLNSKATNHVTSNSSQLENKLDYVGKKWLQVGNG